MATHPVRAHHYHANRLRPGGDDLDAGLLLDQPLLGRRHEPTLSRLGVRRLGVRRLGGSNSDRGDHYGLRWRRRLHLNYRTRPQPRRHGHAHQLPRHIDLERLPCLDAAGIISVSIINFSKLKLRSDARTFKNQPTDHNVPTAALPAQCMAGSSAQRQWGMANANPALRTTTAQARTEDSAPRQRTPRNHKQLNIYNSTARSYFLEGHSATWCWPAA